MTKQVVTTRAFILHSRPWRESSLIADVFSEQHGKVSLVAKGIRSSARKKKLSSALLQPFVPVEVSWVGRSDLKTLTAVEGSGGPLQLQGQSLFAGMYLNELLMRLLAEHIDYPEVFHHYGEVIGVLRSADRIEPPLRRFEMHLLESLGYGIPFVEVNADGVHQGELQSMRCYRFIPDSGFLSLQDVSAASEGVFRGEDLLRIAGNQLEDIGTATAAKQLMRQALAPLLGSKPLNSKWLFS